MHVVVLAYGPTQLTRRAISRARKLAGKTHEVLVAAASPAATSAVSKPTGVTTVKGLGRAGLRAALSQLPNEATLLIHDDVVITARGLTAMNRQHSQGSRYIVPYTNDPGTDHFVGPLPTEKGAERTLDQTNVPKETKPASAIRPACILGTKDDLTKLLGEPLADPYAMLRGASNEFSVAGGALASHSTRCLRRFTNDDPVGQPLLVAALIVKDEEEMLPGCLESLASVVDRIEICDTGSTDNTIEIARAAGANVIEREWPDDFGKARNYVLEECRDARYVLWIDADERVVCRDPAHTRRYLATYHAEHQALSIDIVNLQSDGTELYNFSTVRLFHATGTEFRGAVHEAVHLVGDTAPLAGQTFDQLRLLHHGYAADVIAERAKRIAISSLRRPSTPPTATPAQQSTWRDLWVTPTSPRSELLSFSRRHGARPPMPSQPSRHRP
ncbi:MAG: glycosyltransferase family 2 protein [Actinomycetota bacterium]|nr:glycosyltransferase family 2 protein [Actinomycetota bacterium]